MKNLLSASLAVTLLTVACGAPTMTTTDSGTVVTVDAGTVDAGTPVKTYTCDNKTKTTTVMFTSNTLVISNVKDAAASCFDILASYTGFAQEGRGSISADGKTVILELYFKDKTIGHSCADGAVGSSTVKFAAVGGAAPVAFTGNAQQTYRIATGGAAGDYSTGAKITAYFSGKTMVMTGSDIPSSPVGYSQNLNLGAASQCYNKVTITTAGAAGQENFTVVSDLGQLNVNP